MATHNPTIVEKLKKRVVELHKGAVVKDTKAKESKGSKESNESKEEKAHEEKKEEKNH
jgi:ABC-type multidrug transport system ATPase subunit